MTTLENTLVELQLLFLGQIFRAGSVCKEVAILRAYYSGFPTKMVIDIVPLISFLVEHNHKSNHIAMF